MLFGHTSPALIPMSSATRSCEARPRPEPIDPVQDFGEQCQFAASEQTAVRGEP
jgi:hypothetical protein